MRALLIVLFVSTAHAAPAHQLDEVLEEDERDGLELDDAGAQPPGTGERVAGAPKVADVIAAAERAAGLNTDPAKSWLRRARVSGLIPWVTVRGARETTWDDPDTNIGHSQTYEVRATWRLDRLLYDGRELQIAGVEAARRRERRRLASRVIRSYFTWQRARVAAVRHPTWGSHAEEAAAELDALTDGWFSETLTNRARNLPPP